MARDNNVDQALRVLKKKMQREGIFREMKQRRSYEKPSERKVCEKAARKKAQREGLIDNGRKKKALVGSAQGQRSGMRPRSTSPRF